jgi:hypothetical protein
MENQTKPEPAVEDKTKNARPNENGAVHVEAFMRIFDPKTKETFVEGRA